MQQQVRYLCDGEDEYEVEKEFDEVDFRAVRFTALAGVVLNCSEKSHVFAPIFHTLFAQNGMLFAKNETLFSRSGQEFDRQLTGSE
jgi:hypothetical protein